MNPIPRGSALKNIHHAQVFLTVVESRDPISPFCFSLFACLMLMKFGSVQDPNHNSTARFQKFELDEISTHCFFVLLLVGCTIMNLGTVTLPTLGGDQVMLWHATV